MELASAAPDSVAHPLADVDARRRILGHLTAHDRRMLGSGTCISSNRPVELAQTRTVAVARRIAMYHAIEIDRGRYQGENGDSYIEFEFDQSLSSPIPLSAGAPVRSGRPDPAQR